MPLPVIRFFAWEMFRGSRCIYNDYKALPRGSNIDICLLCYILLTTWPRNHYQWHILCLFEVCKVTKHLSFSEKWWKGYCYDFQGKQWEKEWIEMENQLKQTDTVNQCLGCNKISWWPSTGTIMIISKSQDHFWGFRANKMCICPLNRN